MTKLTIDILTLFPEMFTEVLNSSILGKAQRNNIIQYQLINFRDYSQDKHSRVDDYPYGGGEGMVLKPEPIYRALEELGQTRESSARVILLCPQGQTYTQRKAEELAEEDHLIFICGHYEGFDERIRQFMVTDEISIGDYILTGGELAAMVVIDSIVRLKDGVLGNEQSSKEDTFSTGLLEYPQYTRPAQYNGMSVPDVLLSGNHQKISEWRNKQSLLNTYLKRPDLLQKYSLSNKEQSWIKEFKNMKR